MCVKLTNAGGFEQHRPAVQSGGQKSPSGAFLDARLATSTRTHPSDSSRVPTHRGCFIFVCAWCSSMQHILEVEKNGAFVTNLSQKGYKRPFSPRKDCETIVYLVSYRGGWQMCRSARRNESRSRRSIHEEKERSGFAAPGRCDVPDRMRRQRILHQRSKRRVRQLYRHG